jgi:fibronectin-binding autotransporter adhesin
MSTTISSYTSVSSTLNLTAGETLTVTSNGTIVPTGADFAPLVASPTGTTPVTVVNAGAIDGFPSGNSGGYYSGIALSLGSGGSVTNSGGIVGYATSTAYGIVSGGTLHLVNQGGIEGSSDLSFAAGVSMAAGTVLNQGLIFGFGYGADGVLATGPLTLTNQGGVIYGTGDGVALNSGTISNANGGFIGGDYDGISASQTLTLTNQGLIEGSFGSGVALKSGTITNLETNGTISGYYVGVSASNVISLANSGVIVASGEDATGIYLGEGGVVSNNSGGLIYGDMAGIYANAPLTLNNAGTINAYNYGVNMAGGSVNNSGTITAIGSDDGPTQGIANDYGTLTLVNSGTIAAYAAYGSPATGVALDSGTVTNSGTILATSSFDGTGVALANYLPSGGTLALSNSGTIEATGTGGTGVFVGYNYYGTNQATITNLHGGTISGGYDGAGIASFSTLDVSNAGTITATGSFSAGIYADTLSYVNGVPVYGTDTIVNRSGGVISGGGDGILAYGTIVVANAGTITGGYDGIQAGGAFGLTDLKVSNSGTISGYNAGVDSLGTLQLTNNVGGTIEATGTDGVGVFVQGAMNTMINSGVVEATGAYGRAVVVDNLMPSRGSTYISGATIVNEGSGVIQGGQDGIYAESLLTLANAGTIIGASNDAVALGDGVDAAYGDVTNAGMIMGGVDGVAVAGTAGLLALSNSGTIEGGTYGVTASSLGVYNSGLIEGGNAAVASDPLSLVNTGTIDGTGTVYGFGVETGGGFIDNAGSGLIEGRYGVVATAAAGTLDVLNLGTINGTVDGISAAGSLNLTNSGLVNGTGSDGVTLGSGTVSNLSGGVISTTNYDAVASSGPLDLNNSGTIVNTNVLSSNTANAGVSMTSDGTLVNNAGGMISGPEGVYVSNASGSTLDLVNAGTIQSTGPNYIAVNAVSAEADVTLDPGGTFMGEVTVGSGTLTLASAATAGTMTSSGHYVGFNSVYEQSGGAWTVTSYVGTNMPSITVGSGATLTLDGGVAAGDSITLDPSTIVINDPNLFAGVLNVSPGDVINLPTLPNYNNEDTVTFVSGVTSGHPYLVIDAVSSPGNTANYTIDLSPSVNTNDVFTPSNSDLTITVGAPCFAPGTRIATPAGEVAVERIRAGDEVVTASGAVRKVKWVGKRSLYLAAHPHPEKLRPVCIRAHAFGENLPRRDLWVSPGHAIHWQDALIPAERLVNGASVYQADVGFVTYHHVELESHDLLISEGLASESYLDAGNRGNFEGEDGFVLHPDLSAAAEGAAEGCLPRLFEGPVVASARAHLLSRLPVFGAERAEEPVELGEVWASVGRLGVLTVGENEVIIPAGVERVELRSSTFVPAGLDPACEDCRTLGVRLLGLALDGTELGLDAPVLARGFHDVEPDGRWTDGSGLLVLEPSSQSRTLSLTLAARPAGWRTNTARVQRAA